MLRFVYRNILLHIGKTEEYCGDTKKVDQGRNHVAIGGTIQRKTTFVTSCLYAIWQGEGGNEGGNTNDYRMGRVSPTVQFTSYGQLGLFGNQPRL